MTNKTHHELPKARLCSSVILAWLHGEPAEIEKSITALKIGIGSNWSVTTAMQFMSGKQAKVALSYGRAEEQVLMLIAHEITREICYKYGLEALSKPEDIDRAGLLALASSTQYQLSQRTSLTAR